MTLLILAAGLGTRYGGLKQIAPLTEKGECVIDLSIQEAIKVGFTRVVFLILKENLEEFRETVGLRVEDKIRVEYVFQDLNKLPDGFFVSCERTKPWGTGHAVWCAVDVIGNDRFAVINANELYGQDVFVQLAKHLQTPFLEGNMPHYCMIANHIENEHTELDALSRIECRVKDGMFDSTIGHGEIEERKNEATCLAEIKPRPIETVLSMNCWGFTADLFRHLENGFCKFLQANKEDLSECEYDLLSAVQEQKNAGLCDVWVYLTSAQWFGVTYPEDTVRAKAIIEGLIQKNEYPF